jgi:hypothetical protein
MKRILMTAAACVAISACGAPALRTVLSNVTEAAEIAIQQTRRHCIELARTGCKTNPCPALEDCKAADRYITDGAMLITAGAQRLNK